MVSTDLLPESVTETRRIYPDPQSEPDPSPEPMRGISRTETMMPPPLPHESSYQPLENFQQPRPSPPPSWLWPDGSWLSDFAFDMPASPRFPTESQFWTMPSPFIPQHGYLPAQVHDTAHAWGSLPPQAHAYRRDAGAVGSSMTF
ncbi:hypothetical protein CP533_3058 [Ophiocordyceps camponoti-saundersi (nom. inval.)]|nr:hypothetical protein CP533_3058 [Ophiocordyceps camponoti-saundersi (nom. inval.)]